MSSVLKGGRLKGTRRDVVNFISSLESDKRIAFSTVLVNEAHVIALVRSGVIEIADARRILRALRTLEGYNFTERNAEDVHVVIEDSVTKRTSKEVGGLLHLGKSRNDQVVTAIRMTLRSEIIVLSDQLLALEFSILNSAKKHIATVFPGYTHLQPAQPISFAHYLLANCASLSRDIDRLTEAYGRVNRSPMGAAALAGTSFPLNRRLIARLLGFDGLVDVSLDAVGGRDFALEILGNCALIASDLQRIATDLIFYSSAEVGLVVIPDEFASTSSIMPQKKNADPLELTRAKCAKIAANFNSGLSIMHGLPSGYNLDYQELTPLLWESIDELKACVRILTEIIPRIAVDSKLSSRRYLEFTAATEIANILVREEHLPFRTAHHLVGSVARSALSRGVTFKDMKRSDWERALGGAIRPRTVSSIIEALDLGRHLRMYRTSGSPNPQESKRLIAQELRACERSRTHNARLQARLRKAMQELRAASKS
ncbi:MAG: argininosuccinate lyase [Candidatus Bathyarchaeia archaeon]